jgi:hypothetical protein
VKVLASHKFKNGKEMQVLYLNRTDQRKLGVPEVDTMAFARLDENDIEWRTYITPIEAIIIIQLLAEALNVSVKAWKVGIR